MPDIGGDFFSVSSRSLRLSVRDPRSRLDVRDWIGETLILISKMKKWLSLTYGDNHCWLLLPRDGKWWPQEIELSFPRPLHICPRRGLASMLGAITSLYNVLLFTMNISKRASVWIQDLLYCSNLLGAFSPICRQHPIHRPLVPICFPQIYFAFSPMSRKHRQRQAQVSNSTTRWHQKLWKRWYVW